MNYIVFSFGIMRYEKWDVTALFPIMSEFCHFRLFGDSYLTTHITCMKYYGLIVS